MLNSDDVYTAYQRIGLKIGDTLVVQSSYKGIGGFEGGPEALIQALLCVVGPEGTLIMPAYNFTSWTQDHVFDVLETPSTRVGIIPETFRLMKGVRRTRHPIHSLSVYGKRRDELCAIDHADSFGEDSIFAKLLELNSMYSTLGTGLNMPFLPCHYTETLMKVPYRYQKFFNGTYMDESRIPREKTYGFHVRNQKINKKPVFDTHIMQFKRGYVKEVTQHGMTLMYSRADDYHESMLELIKEKPELFR